MVMRMVMVLLIASGPVFAQELNDESFEKWRDFILPNEKELEWMHIPWRPSFWDGLVEGQREKKPVLLWTMNGHPLACT